MGWRLRLDGLAASAGWAGGFGWRLRLAEAASGSGGPCHTSHVSLMPFTLADPTGGETRVSPR
jgi:hypothetical protein